MFKQISKLKKENNLLKTELVNQGESSNDEDELEALYERLVDIEKENMILNYEINVITNELYIPRFRNKTNQGVLEYIKDIVPDKDGADTEIFIYTDGSLMNNKFGGWAFFVCNANKDILHEYCGPIVFNNAIDPQVCEGLAILKALRFIAKRYKNVTVCSDCQVLINELAPAKTDANRSKSRRRRAKSKAKQETRQENINVMQSIKQFVKKEKLEVEWQWVKSHAGLPGNEICDTMAKIGAKIARIIESKDGDLAQYEKNFLLEDFIDID